MSKKSRTNPQSLLTAEFFWQCLVCYFLLPITPLSQARPPSLIIWRVGQGQWITASEATYCLHFDMGGEHWDRSALVRECAGKKNFAVFSHWDWDHISFARQAQKHLANLCLLQEPTGPTTSKKRQFLAALPTCENHLPRLKRLMSTISPSTKSAQANAHSRVWTWRRILIPGDSPSSMEKHWLGEIPAPSTLKILVLGHHGSRTSTSHLLLDTLRGLSWTAASARRKKYGHPHPHVMEKLKRRGLSLLLTEDWGHIRIAE